jgi:prepilin-type N-terminal cleavage/methylation domain-containing protein
VIASLLRRRRRRRTQAGFTLVELLMGCVLSAVFAFAIYGFFFTTLDHARSQQSQWMAQSTGRTAIDRLSGEIRQAVSPDDGLTPPIISVSPTAVEMYVDPSRALTAVRPVPHKVRYSLVSGQLVRDRAVPSNTTAPFIYGAYGAREVLVERVQNGAVPLFAPVTEDGVALSATLAAGSPTLRDVAQLTVRLVIGQQTGAKATTMELNTDVALRNSIRL